MTFIATVVAKKGAALIADSLVTTSKNVLEHDAFSDYLKSKAKDGEGDIKIDVEELNNLFVSKPSHTKDYHEKIFEFDQYTAISTAGAAYIGEKSLEELIDLAKQKLKVEGWETKKIDEKASLIEDFFKEQATEALKNKMIVRYSVLLITHYEKENYKASIFKLEINRAAPEDDLDREGFSITFL